MKRIWIMILACLLAFALLPVVQAAEDFSFNPDSHTITGYSGTDTVVKVPASIGGVKVLAIGEGAFDQRKDIVEVVLPEGLTHILRSAFYFCEKLERIQLPSSLQVVDSYAFFGCSSLSSLTFPPSLVYVDDKAFSVCGGLDQVVFQGSAPYVAPDAFEQGPDNRQFTVPAEELAAYEALLGVSCQAGGDVIRIQANSQVTVDPATGAVTAYTGFDADLVIPGSVDGVQLSAIGERAFFGNLWIRRLQLPEGIKNIGRQAFYASKLGVVKLQEGLETIGEEAFAAANLKQLHLPASLRSLGRHAFASGKFPELVIPEALVEIPEGAFSGNHSLKDVSFPASLSAIGPEAFQQCGSLSYLIFAGDQAPEVAQDAFQDCPLEDIDIHWQASKAQANAFRDALIDAGLPMEGVAIWRANPPHQPPYPANATLAFDEDSQLITQCEGDFEALTMFWNFWKADRSGTLDIRGLGPGVFEGSQLKAFHVPHSGAFEIISERAFANSQIETLYLFDTVKVIGKEAFLNCQNLKELVLPESVERIEEGAFRGCSKLVSLVFKGQAVHIGQEAFAGCDSLAELVLPPDTQAAGDLGAPATAYRIQAAASEEQRLALQAALNLPWYLDLPREGEAVALISMPDSLVPNPETEFEFDAATGFITKYIGQAPKVVVPRAIGGVTVLGIDFLAFSNLNLYAVATGTGDNQGLNEVVLPETITQIGDSAFLNCTGLKQVICYGPLERIGVRAFESCTALEEIVCHNGVRELSDYCFHLCASLKKAELGNKLQKLPEGAFSGCGFEGLLVLNVPEVGKLAYQNNKQVTTIHILPGVKHLGAGVFLGMDALKEVCFAQTDPGLLQDGYQFDDKATGLIVHVPTATSDEGLAAFQKTLNLNLLPGNDMVSRKDCALEEHDGPAPAESTEAPADEPAEQPAETSAPEAAGTADITPAQGAGPLLDQRYSCIGATTGGIELDMGVIGEYALVFSADGTVVFTVYGAALPPIGYTVQDGVITLDYVAGPLVLQPVEGGYEMDFMGAMLMTFALEDK